MKCPDLVEESASAGRSDMQLYQEALSCMELIASQIESDTDYPMVVQLYQRCSAAITALSTIHHNPHISASLEDLLETLSFQKSVLDGRQNAFHHHNNNNSRDRRRVVSEGPFKYADYPGKVNGITKLSGATRSGAGEGSGISSGSDAIQDMLVPYCGQGGLMEEVVGLGEVKEVLREAVVMPIKYPQLFQGGAKPWRRLLLYGPPGTGKTKLARALASELQCSFYCVSSANLLSSWVGESEKLIRDLFEHARRQANQTFIFIDEIDWLCRKRSQGEDEHSRRVKSELLRQLEGAGGEEAGSEAAVLVLGATNCPWDLDTAFLRRFQRRLYVPLPTSEERRALISAQFNQSPPCLTESEWQTLLLATQGHSGADLTHLATAAAFQPIRELQVARFWRFTDDNKITPCSSDTLGAMQYPLCKLPADKVTAREVKLKDFLTALETTPRTVSPDDLRQFEVFTGTTQQSQL